MEAVFDFPEALILLALQIAADAERNEMYAVIRQRESISESDARAQTKHPSSVQT